MKQKIVELWTKSGRTFEVDRDCESIDYRDGAYSIVITSSETQEWAAYVYKEDVEGLIWQFDAIERGEDE